MRPTTHGGKFTGYTGVFPTTRNMEVADVQGLGRSSAGQHRVSSGESRTCGDRMNEVDDNTVLVCNAPNCRRVATHGVFCRSPTGSLCDLMYAFCDYHLEVFERNSSPGEIEVVPVEDIG